MLGTSMDACDLHLNRDPEELLSSELSVAVLL